MILFILEGLLIPFIGTALGAMCVLFLKRRQSLKMQRYLMGFSAGVMTAASVWSLLLPSEELSQNLGKLSFIPPAAGFCLGVAFLMVTDRLTSFAKNRDMLTFAVVLHNIPEGMAVGAACTNLLIGNDMPAVSALFMLSLGIAVQNIPEGAIISMPCKAAGKTVGRSLLAGVLSGAVEPIAGAATILLSSLMIPILPYTLSFAAGAMIYVVIKELVPEMNEGETRGGIIMFTLGFIIMMALDIALG